MLNMNNQLKDSNISHPLVSVIIPMYNASRYIERCINSISRQNYKNIEIIIVDDGSSDDSLTIASYFSKTKSNIKVLSQENRGACAARNNGIKNSNGKYLKFIDADDELLPNVISKQVRLSESLSENYIVYGDLYLYHQTNKRNTYFDTSIPKIEQTAHLIFTDILTSTPLHRRWMLEKIGGFDERFKNGQEWNLHIRLSSEGFFFYHMKEPIYKYHIFESEDRISSKSKADETKSEYFLRKIDMTEERLGNHSSGDIQAAFAYVYWRIGRELYHNDLNVKADLFFNKARNRTRKYKLYWPTLYKISIILIGFKSSEKIIKIISKLKKTKKFA